MTDRVSKRVLMIDDNERMLDILKEFLSEAYHVDVATTPSAGLAHLVSHVPDVILLDVNMPGTDGLTLLESLRQQGVTIPVIIMTGYDGPDTEERAMSVGARAYVVKPPDLRHLDRLIASALKVPPILHD